VGTLRLIWASEKAKYFCGRGWTGFCAREVICPTGQTQRHCPRAIIRWHGPRAEKHWYEASGIGRKEFKSTCFETVTKAQAKQLVVCVDNDGYAVSLEKRKIYVALRDAAAEKHGLLRIIDESGEDYLYPKALFRAIELPQAVRRAVLAA
jgi:hypothetical protein